MQISLRDPDDLEQLKRRIGGERHAQQRDRYRAVLGALDGQPASRIAAKLDPSKHFVQRWAYAYRDGGIDAITAKRQTGAPTKLRRDQEEAFKQRLDAGPNPRADGGVCTLRGKDVVGILQQEFGASYSLSGAYDLLQRLGYACLKPRPRHRKNDPEAMAAWKQDTPLLSKRFENRSPRSKSRSGSRTRRGSASKARCPMSGRRRVHVPRP